MYVGLHITDMYVLHNVSQLQDSVTN